MTVWWIVPVALIPFSLWITDYIHDSYTEDVVGFVIWGVALGIVIGHYL